MAAMVPKRQLDERSKFLRNLLFWLLLLPVVLGSLLLCGQMALWFSPSEQAIDTRSLIKANYQPWMFQQVPAVDVAALQQDVMNDQGTTARVPASTLETGEFWPKLSATPVILAGPVETFSPTKPGSIATRTLTPTPTTVRSTPTQTQTFTPMSATLTLTAQATVTGTPVRTATPTPTPTRTSTFLVASNTPRGTYTATPTATRTLSIWTPTPTRTPIIIRVTFTFTPTQTDVPATRTFTPTPTFTSTPTATFTPTNIFSPTPTFTFTPTPTNTAVPVYLPLRSMVEGLADPVGTDACEGYFGYNNNNPYDVTIEKGERNQIIGSYLEIIPNDPPYQDADVPTLFYSDHWVAFKIVWNTPGPISWYLDGWTATFNWCR